MSNKTRINKIESLLQTKPKDISTNDLIYYLKVNSNNEILNPNNLKITEDYLYKIHYSYALENIFVNTSNYSSNVLLLIGLLVPFYYFYPRFYNIGFFGFSIGIFCFFGIFSSIKSYYSQFFPYIGLQFISLTIFIYLIFFVALNKLNHISLFFISAVISYALITYILRIILTLPFDSNKLNNYNASIDYNKINKGFTEYNVLLETASLEIIDRFRLNLPSGNMLYTYLSRFKIGPNESKISDFVINIISPLISVGILKLLGIFLSIVEDKTISDFNIDNENGPLKLFPLIGINNNSFKYYTCQANYILPRELNVHLLIHEIVDKYNFNDTVYLKIEKALVRISNELLSKYNPKFSSETNNTNIIQNLKNNKIFNEICKLLKRNNFNFEIENVDQIRQFIKTDEDIPYRKKEEMNNLLLHINNVLKIENDINEYYNNNSTLAKEELLYDKEIDKEYKKTLDKISSEYIQNFTKNLNLDNNTLYGYHYNIITYNLFSTKIRVYANKIFKMILGLMSTWLLFTKPIGSGWLISKFILSSFNGFKRTLRYLSGNSTIWKYFSMGLDREYYKDKYNKLENKNDNSILTKSKNILYTLLIFIIIAPVLYYYNNINFGLTLSPEWYNIIFQFIFILNILGNIYYYYNDVSLISYNIIFFVCLIIIPIIIFYIIIYFV
jgi:hypothetical protein